MQSEIEGYIRQIAENVSRELGDTLDVSTLRWIRPPDGGKLVDSTLPFFVDGRNARDNIVLLVSNQAFPDAVAEDMERFRQAAKFAFILLQSLDL